jgi:regulator of replication initiation timing
MQRKPQKAADCHELEQRLAQMVAENTHLRAENEELSKGVITVLDFVRQKAITNLWETMNHLLVVQAALK